MKTVDTLDPEEISQLQQMFNDVVNYDALDTPINPITYVAPDGDTCLHIAAARNDVRSIELLLKAGLDVNTKGDMRSTPLHYAYRMASDRAIAFLLENGADENAIDAFRKKPEDLARSK